jgi:hypothetical protein
MRPAFFPVAVLLAIAVAGCAQSQPQRAKKATAAPDPTKSSEDVGFEAERRINAAESELLALNPDAAVEQLSAAETSLNDPRIRSYPDALALRKRHTDLTAKVPEVRAEVKKRELAAAVQAARAKIDEAKARVKEAITNIKKKNPEEAELKQAEDAVTSLKNAIDEASDLESKDAEYSKYATAARKDLQANKEIVARRDLEVAIDRSREEIAKATGSLSAALDRIKRNDVTEENFTEAKAAADEVKNAIGRGESLASKEPKHGKYLAQLKEKLEAQKKSIDQRQQDVAVQRQRAKVEEARKALAAAIARLKGKDVTEEHLAEADSAVAAVSKALEEGGELKTKDKNYSGYSAEMKKKLEEATAQVAKRRLEVEIDLQRGRVNQAIAAVKQATARLNMPEDCDAADAAVGDLEKTIEAGDKYGAKDAGYSKLATEARKTAVAARKNIGDRREEIAMDTQRAKVQTELDSLKGALAGLEGFSPGEEQFTQATNALAAVKKALDDGAELEKKLVRYSTWANETRKKLAGAQQKIEARKREIAVRERRMLIEDAVTAAKAGIDNAKRADATGDIVKEATNAIKNARDEIEKGKDLERNDVKYEQFATWARKQVDQFQATLNGSSQTVAFREGPIAALAEGLAATEGVSRQAPDEQKKAYTTALELFKKCQKDAASIIADHPAIGSMQFPVGRTKAKGSRVLAACAENSKSVETKLAAVEIMVAFYEGPAKSFEKAKALLAEAESAADPAAKKKVHGEALSQFEACLEAGRLLQYKHPQLKTAKFDLGGEKVTLPAIVATCQKQAKSLRAGGDKT